MSPALSAAESGSASRDSREIRVFLSSTFRDFMAERELLAKRVFPALNRRARERGVELVEVDLRWGVTQEQAEGGQALEICLREIERCKPYFIGMLGDSYGSLTPPELQLQQPTALVPETKADNSGDRDGAGNGNADISRDGLRCASDSRGADDSLGGVSSRAGEDLGQDLASWLQGRMGQSSYTDLEIERGLQLLQDPEVAGRAFFYFRDPAYSDPRAEAGELGWRSDDPDSRLKLDQLKERIRRSGHHLVEGLADPEAIATQIEADIWALIDRQFPEGEQPDALQREDRKHADYRRSRTGEGQYIGGEAYLTQLEQWIASGEQQILITGASGAGKSALIANWMEAHAQAHPDDVLYAHHLGCTNDANALRPLLGRLIQNASRHLIAEQVITEELPIPEDWWELVARVAEALQTLGRWAGSQGRRWIWVLDGLDRLDREDQKVLPWLPQSLPAGVQVVATALACNARTILTERHYTILTIESLSRPEQEQLIDKVLRRYTKRLDPALQKKILSHKLAVSPLFLRVLLEELRQCGRFDTLKEQLGFYLNSQTIDDLYERVLERLEKDGHGDAVRKVMTALWASRAGLSETELLAITGLARIQWAPIDLALEKAVGRNGIRLIFDHSYLQKAVRDRYLCKSEERKETHDKLADWFGRKVGWDQHKAEELPWQLRKANRLDEIRYLLLRPSDLQELITRLGCMQTIHLWLSIKSQTREGFEELIAEELDTEINKRRKNGGELRWFATNIADFLSQAGMHGEELLKLRTLAVDIDTSSADTNDQQKTRSLQLLAESYRKAGRYGESLTHYRDVLDFAEKQLGSDHASTASILSSIGALLQDMGELKEAEQLQLRALSIRTTLYGTEHPATIRSYSTLGVLYQCMGIYSKAENNLNKAIRGFERLIGADHPDTISTRSNLAGLLRDRGEHKASESNYQTCLRVQTGQLGAEHPDTLSTLTNLGLLYWQTGNTEQAQDCFAQALRNSSHLLKSEHRLAVSIADQAAAFYAGNGEYRRSATLYTQAFSIRERQLGLSHHLTLNTAMNLSTIYQELDQCRDAKDLLTPILDQLNKTLGPKHPDTRRIAGSLAGVYCDMGFYNEAESLFRTAEPD